MLTSTGVNYKIYRMNSTHHELRPLVGTALEVNSPLLELFRASVPLENFGTPGPEKMEDSALLIPVNGVAGVLNGVNAPYHPRDGAKLYDGRRGSQIVTETVGRALVGADATENLVQQIAIANRAVHQRLAGLGISRDHPIFLPSTTGAFLRINPKTYNPEKQFCTLEVAAFADARYIVELKDGQVHVSPNRVAPFTTEAFSNLRRIRVEHGAIDGVQMSVKARDAVWDKYLSYYSARGDSLVNGSCLDSYAILNGDSNFPLWIHRNSFSLDLVSTVIIFTDGLVGEIELDDVAMAKRVLAKYKAGGLDAVLSETRGSIDPAGGASMTSQRAVSAYGLQF